MKPANEEMSRKKNDSVGTPSTPGPQHEKTSRKTDISDKMNESHGSIEQISLPTKSSSPYKIGTQSTHCPPHYFSKLVYGEMSTNIDVQQPFVGNERIGDERIGDHNYKGLLSEQSVCTPYTNENSKNNEKIERKKKSTYVDPVCKSERTYKYDSDHYPTMSKSKGKFKMNFLFEDLSNIYEHSFTYTYLYAIYLLPGMYTDDSTRSQMESGNKG